MSVFLLIVQGPVARNVVSMVVLRGWGLGWDVPEELISRYEAPTILDFLNKHVLIGADDGFREQCYIRNY